MTGIGKAAAVGLGAAATAFGGLAVKALQLGGDLEQNLGGAEAVFGRFADAVKEKGTEAFETMGLSQSDFLATANKMGALFQGAGFDIQSSMELSTEAMQRAADVASIMGIDTTSAMESIAGAAKGNFTMMDNLGVAMNATTIEAYALSKGINTSYNEMTNQQKIGLAMEMFLEKTAYATGNYAKENMTLAGALSTAKAALTNFLSGAGDVESLVSSVSNLADVLLSKITELLPRLTTGLGSVVQQLIPKIPPLLQELLPAMLTGARALLDGLVSALPSMVDVLSNILPMVAENILGMLPVMLEAGIEIISAIALGIANNIPLFIPIAIDAISKFADALIGNIGTLADAAIQIVTGLANGLIQALPILIEKAPELIGKLVEAIKQNVPMLLDAASAIIKALADGLGDAVPIIKPILDVLKVLADNLDLVLKVVVPLTAAFIAYKAAMAISSIIQTVTVALDGMTVAQWLLNAAMSANPVGLLVAGFAALIAVIADFVGNWDNISNGLTTLWEDIQYGAGKVVNAVGGAFTGLWDGIKTSTQSAVDFIGGVFTGFGKAAEKTWTYVSDTISSSVDTALDNVGESKSGFAAFADNVIGSIREIPTKAKGFWEDFSQGFKLLTQSVVSIAKGDFTDVHNTIMGILNPMPEEIRGVGRDMVRGFKDGMERETPGLFEAVDAMTRQIVDKSKAGLAIASPSKVFADIGGNVVKGFVVGIETARSAIDSTMNDTFGDLGRSVDVGLNLSSAGTIAATSQSSVASGAGEQLIIQGDVILQINPNDIDQISSIVELFGSLKRNMRAMQGATA